LAKEKEEADAAEAARQQKIQREADEKKEAERIAAQKLEAERRAEQERIEAEERAKIRAAEIEAEKPDREKLVGWAKSVAAEIAAIPEVQNVQLGAEAEELRSDILNLLNVFAHEMEVV
jgi:hypothetical protein